MKIGPYSIDIVSDGRIWLDGGAMFGVVPKPLWSKIIEVDEMNRVPLDTSSLVVRGPAGTILVETGIGDNFSEKQHKIYNLDFGDRLLENLSDRGIAPEDVDMVIQTHLHFDHCGSLLQKSAQGSYGPTFPNAEVVIQKGEWEAALNPDARSRPSYFPVDFYEALSLTGRLRLVEGEVELGEGISVKPLSGHTVSHQVFVIQQDGETVVYTGDFIPMTRHISVSYSMGFDMFPITTVEHKEEFLPYAADGGWYVVFVHDPDTPIARIKRDGEKWRTEPVLKYDRSTRQYNWVS